MPSTLSLFRIELRSDRQHLHEPVPLFIASRKHGLGPEIKALARQQREVRRHVIIRILVVDDFAPWLRFVSSIVEKEPGWQIVCEVSDGLEAVHKAEELQPDLVLLDVGLPELNGIEAARQIRKIFPNLKILFLSAFDSVGVVEDALNTGASGYVVKVDAGGELVGAVEAVLQGKRFVSSALKGCISVDDEPHASPACFDARYGFGIATWSPYK